MRGVHFINYSRSMKLRTNDIKRKIVLFTSFLAHVGIILALKSPVSSWGGWRIALNIHRIPSTNMPSTWASSGVMFPLVIKCNFTEDGMVTPMYDSVRYTASGGEVRKPVLPGSWMLKGRRDLCFSLSFPQRMVRNGVEIGPGEVSFTGLLFTTKDLNDLNDEFFKARSVTDQINAEVKEAQSRREAPKKWNFETKKWEKRYRNESFISGMNRRVKQWKAMNAEEIASKHRPKAVDLSLESGEFPGLDCKAFIQKEGSITMNGALIGTWGAGPITDSPPSYYRPSY